MQRNNPHDHQSIGSKNARAASRAPRTRAQMQRKPPHADRFFGRSRAPRTRAQIKAAAARPGPVLVGPAVTPRLRLLEASSEQRKAYPVTSGVLDYFPDAMAAVAEVSFVGNQKHNPGEPLHWARGKSMDHADCIGRHLIERGGFDGSIRHSAALAWRALALLQEELEAEHNLAAPRGATAA